MISIVIPLFNKEKQIRNTLKSVFDQTFQRFEVVIVNDGSTDGSVEVVREFTDDRIRLIHQENQGVSIARNRGIQEAKYDYVALLDADDEWKPDYLQTQVDLISKYPECSVFACAYEFKQSDGTISQIILNKMSFTTLDGILTNYFEVASCSHPPLWTSAVVVRRKAFVSIGGFPVGVIAGEDLLTWARLAVRYQIAYSRTPKVYFCLSDSESYLDSPSRKPDKDDVVGISLQKIYKENRQVVGLRQYVSLWYKMRASMLLLLGDNKSVFCEAIKSLRYNPFNIKVWAYLGMLFLPLSCRYKVFRKFGSA